MKHRTFDRPRRLALFFAFIKMFLVLSILLRTVFLFLQKSEVSWNVIDVARTILTGMFFDIGVLSFFMVPAILYYSLFPKRWIGSAFDKIFVCFFTALIWLILVFTFFAEITFWDEFKSRFNFIAVDYLIYTHEVIANIKESYPLPLLIGSVAIFTLLIMFVFYTMGSFYQTFNGNETTRTYISVSAATIAVAIIFGAFISNNQAEWSSNRYNSEISKSGIYSFFAAFRNNQMLYSDFYTTLPIDQAFAMVKSKLGGPHVKFQSDGFSIHRTITDSLPSDEKKNVVFILVESLSANLMTQFGEQHNITPFLDSLSTKSIFFNNLYATGTRTVRGMEAVTLCIPPTPGQSIVKRPDNHNLFTVASVFGEKGYDNNFFYGGDGYFDNMNSYFGGNGFTIYDRGRGSVLSDKIKTERYNISDKEVSFENAWGICDEDIFNKMLSVADENYAKGKPFFNFVMTTSNHRPFTYPGGKVAIPPGMNREGAVQYTDYAIRELFGNAAKKPWFKNTVFVIIADHCASSAGKNEIDQGNYHIPAFIANFDQAENQIVSKQCSQIDIFPTLFSLMHWNYESDFFGKNVLDTNFEERSFSGTYRKLSMLKGDKIAILSDQKKQSYYQWDKAKDHFTPLPMDNVFLAETIAWYQTADYLFTKKMLK